MAPLISPSPMNPEYYAVVHTMTDDDTPGWVPGMYTLDFLLVAADSGDVAAIGVEEESGGKRMLRPHEFHRIHQGFRQPGVLYPKQCFRKAGKAKAATVKTAHRKRRASCAA